MSKITIKTKQQTNESLLESAILKIKENGGTLSCNVKEPFPSGNFSIKMVEGTWSVIDDHTIEVDIISKPFFISNKFIEDNLNKFFS